MLNHTMLLCRLSWWLSILVSILLAFQCLAEDTGDLKDLKDKGCVGCNSDWNHFISNSSNPNCTKPFGVTLQVTRIDDITEDCVSLQFNSNPYTRESGSMIEYEIGSCSFFLNVTNSINGSGKRVSILIKDAKGGNSYKVEKILVNDALLKLYKDSILISKDASEFNKIECNPFDNFDNRKLTITQRVTEGKDSGMYLFFDKANYNVTWISAHYLEEPTTTEEPMVILFTTSSTSTEKSTTLSTSTEKPTTLSRGTEFTNSTEAATISSTEEPIKIIDINLIIGLSVGGFVLLCLLISICASVRCWRKKVHQRREEDDNIKRRIQSMEAYKQRKRMEMVSKTEDQNAKDKPSVSSMNESTQTANQEKAHPDAKSSVDSKTVTSDAKVLKTFV